VLKNWHSDSPLAKNQQACEFLIVSATFAIQRSKIKRCCTKFLPAPTPRRSSVSQSRYLRYFLRAKIQKGRSRRFSLESRFRLAALLATSILELHNVNWLHKNLNSYNLLFFTDEDGNISLTEPYIIGFDFSRPDRPGQKSLTMRSSPWDIYRHPDVRKATPSSKQLQSYRRRYDVFSLGLILFEVGLWRRLDEFTKPNLSPEAFQTRIEGYVERDMSLWMGDTYKRVVQKCLSGDYEQDPGTIALDVGVAEEPTITEESDLTDVSGETENPRGLSGFYSHVVAELGRCQCGAANGRLL